MFSRIAIGIWTMWCTITFSILALIALPIFLLLIIFQQKYLALKWIGLGVRVVYFFWGVQIVEHNKSIIKNSTNYVFVANHRSDLDGMLCNSIIPGHFKFLGKSELLSWPIVGIFVKHLFITVNRKQRHSGINSLKVMLEEARKGTSIAIFPEGFSNFSEELLLPLKRGAFQVALQEQLPMVVFTIIGSHEIWPKPILRIKPGTVHIYWEEVIETKGMLFPKDMRVLKEKVRTVFLNRLKQHYPDGYTYSENHPDFETWKYRQLH